MSTTTTNNTVAESADIKGMSMSMTQRRSTKFSSCVFRFPIKWKGIDYAVRYIEGPWFSRMLKVMGCSYEWTELQRPFQ